MASNIFQNSSKEMPKSDPQIVRVGMKQLDVGGRESHLPKDGKNEMTLKHVERS